MILACLLLSPKLYAQSDEDIIAICERISLEGVNLNYIDKQVRYHDMQRQVDALSKVCRDSNIDSWKSYYIQLYSLLNYFDPSKSMAQYRPYMQELNQLVHRLPAEHAVLRWYAIKRLARLYAFDNNQKQAYVLLEKTIQEIQHKSQRDAQDTMYLGKAMIGQLYCYKALPESQGRRNEQFLAAESQYADVRLGLALYKKDYVSVVQLCDSLLTDSKLGLWESFYISDLMEEALRQLPRNKAHVDYMTRLTALQKKRYADVQKSIHSDYQIYQDWQTKRRQDAELKQQLQAEQNQYIRWGSILGLILLGLIVLLWVIYRQQIRFTESILQRVRSHNDAREATLKESQKAYDAQLRLVRNLNHDIRIPLNALIGFSSLLSCEEELTLELQEDAGCTIRQSNVQLLHMINNLLAIARLETGNMSLHMSNHTVDEVLRAEEWDEFIGQLQSKHLISIQSEQSNMPIETDLGHVRCIIELFIHDITRRQMSNGSVLVNCFVKDVVNKLCICVQASKDDLDVSEMLDALDTTKGMNAYEDANSYYLVHARMVAKLIGGHVQLETFAETVHLTLWLPLK